MPTNLTKQQIRSEVLRLAPFRHKIELPYHLSTHVPELSRLPQEYTRVDNFVKHAFPALIDACGGSLNGKRVLDVACNCGGFSVEAAKLGSEYVLGFDVVDQYIEQANFIKQALGLDQVEFRTMDIENLNESSVGLFDVTFCFGILYHLANPILSMKHLASVTKKIMLVDTNLLRVPVYKRPFYRRDPLWMMNFPAITTPESDYVTTGIWRSKEQVVQFRPTESAVVDMLKFLGFSKVIKLKNEHKDIDKVYYNGRRATFLALRS